MDEWMGVMGIRNKQQLKCASYGDVGFAGGGEWRRAKGGKVSPGLGITAGGIAHPRPMSISSQAHRHDAVFICETDS